MSSRWQKFWAWLLLLVAAYGVVGFGFQLRQFEERLSSTSVETARPLPGQVLLETKSGAFSVGQLEADTYHRLNYIDLGFLLLGAIAANWLFRLRRRGKVALNEKGDV